MLDHKNKTLNISKVTFIYVQRHYTNERFLWYLGMSVTIPMEIGPNQDSPATDTTTQKFAQMESV